MYMHKFLRPCMCRCSTFNNYTYNTTHVYGQYFSEKKTRLLVIVCVCVCFFLYLVETLFLVPRSGRFNTEPHHGTRLKSALCHKCHKCQKWFEIVLSLCVSCHDCYVYFHLKWNFPTARSVRPSSSAGWSVGWSVVLSFFFSLPRPFSLVYLWFMYIYF